MRTTVDLEFQRAAEDALRDGLLQLNEERKTDGSRQERIEGAFASVRPSDGAILAIVGGSAFNFRNQLNRAVDISRPIGSAVKPFIYAIAFASGMKPEDTLVDEPASYKVAKNRRWTPRNYDGKYSGIVPLSTALHKSLNSVAVKLLARVGVDPVIRLLSDATGSPADSFPRNLSLALGTAESSPLRLAGAYSIFVNKGQAVRPYFIRTIEGRDGNILRDGRPAIAVSTVAAVPPILDPVAAQTILQTMRGVLEEGGTAHAAARAARFTLPAAGKTGTTDEYRDAWFSGVTPDLSAAVWIGFDDMRIALGKGKTGGQVAAPIWFKAVKEYYRHRPTREF